MSRHLDRPIASIYDMMIERHRKLTSESESRDISSAKVEVEVTSNTKTRPKKWHLLPAKAVREMPSSLTLKSESYRLTNSVTATHLTKRQTVMRVQPPARKEVIDKLVKKMSMACGRAQAEEVVPQPPHKQVTGIQRKKTSTLGTSWSNQKPNKGNPDRRPLSPKKTDRDPKGKKVGRLPKEKTSVRSMTKTKSPKNLGIRMRGVRESTRSVKTARLSNDRWRI